MPRATRFTTTEDDTIRRKWLKEGESIRSIASYMGRTPGSIASRLSALGLTGKGNRVGRSNKAKPMSAKQKIKTQQERRGNCPPRTVAPNKLPAHAAGLRHPEVSAPAPEHAVTLLALGVCQCRWAYGDRDFLFCGKPTQLGEPWCEYHKDIVHQQKEIEHEQ